MWNTIMNSNHDMTGTVTATNSSRAIAVNHEVEPADEK